MAVRQIRKTGTREAVLDAALEVFTEKGYGAAGIEDIRTRSGASVGSIYHHFAGKEQIAAALYARGLEDYRDGLLAALSRSRGAEAGIRAIVRHHLRWVASEPALAGFLMNRRETEVVAASEERVHALNRETFGRIAEWQAEQVRSGALNELPLDLLLAIALGPAQEFARHQLAGRATSSRARAERTLGEAAWAALSTQSSPVPSAAARRSSGAAR